MAGRLVSSIHWGRIADNIGRKPCLIIGCFSVSIFSIMFGCSDSFIMAIASRFLLGFFNPIWGIAKTLVSELCTKSQEATAMGITTGCWSLGLIFGPAFGGLFASPCELYPETFGNMDSDHVFCRYPYLLPNLITAFFGILAAILVYTFFPETLFSKAPKVSYAMTQNSEEDCERDTIENRDSRETSDMSSIHHSHEKNRFRGDNTHRNDNGYIHVNTLSEIDEVRDCDKYNNDETSKEEKGEDISFEVRPIHDQDNDYVHSANTNIAITTTNQNTDDEMDIYNTNLMNSSPSSDKDTKRGATISELLAYPGMYIYIY